MVRRLWLLAISLTLLSTACGLDLRSRRAPAAVDPVAAPVGLITDGPAFQRPQTREQVQHVIEQVTRRRVVLLDSPSSTIDANLMTFADTLAKKDRAVAKYDWREPRCTADPVVLLALQSNLDAIYRVSLDHSERLRPPTETEAAELARRTKAVRVVRGVFGVARRDTVSDESYEGSIVLWSFARTVATQKARISRQLTQLEPTSYGDKLDVEPAVAEAMAQLPAVAPAEWDTTARRLVAAGCPLLAMAVYDARLQSGGKHRDIKTAALAAIRRNTGKRSPKDVAKGYEAKVNTAIEQGDLDEAASALARYTADPAANPDTVKKLTQAVAQAREKATGRTTSLDDVGTRDEKYSCRTLCGMHMVEMCNKDKALWSAHRMAWGATPCGTMRDEAFLRDCYKQQWLNGAFADGCLSPCESSEQGRGRLLAILQEAGCMRPRPF